MTTKISTLPTLATVTDATIIPVVESGTTKKITGAALKTYTGSGDIVLVKTASFSGVANTSTTFDGVFTSAYKSYRVVVRQIYTDSYAGGTSLAMNLRVGGSTNTAANHNYTYTKVVSNGNTAVEAASGQTFWFMPQLWSNPATSSFFMEFTGVGVSSGEILARFSGLSNGTSSWYTGGVRWEGSAITADGFILTSTGANMSGTVDVYGYK
jgi:hypothetical protein